MHMSSRTRRDEQDRTHQSARWRLPWACLQSGWPVQVHLPQGEKEQPHNPISVEPHPDCGTTLQLLFYPYKRFNDSWAEGPNAKALRFPNNICRAMLSKVRA
eukprot:731590-Amphidinium_carterae.1